MITDLAVYLKSLGDISFVFSKTDIDSLQSSDVIIYKATNQVVEEFQYYFKIHDF